MEMVSDEKYAVIHIAFSSISKCVSLTDFKIFSLFRFPKVYDDIWISSSLSYSRFTQHLESLG